MRLLFLLGLFFATVAIGYTQQIPVGQIDKAFIHQTVTKGADIFQKNYTFPALGTKVFNLLMDNLKKGKYDKISNVDTLAARLTTDIFSICKDKHAGWRVEPVKPNDSNKPSVNPLRLIKGFTRVEVLPGNIGYLEIKNFPHRDEASKIAAAAMELLAETDAVIFDLRNNGGGDNPEYLLGFLFDQPIPVNKSYSRDNGKETIEDIYTDKITPAYSRLRIDPVNGEMKADTLSSLTKKLATAKVYVLTSKRTFSAAESFAYTVQSLKRGKIIGEKTRGGAHATQIDRVNDKIILRTPYSRSENVVTKTDWEGVGILPDIEVDALDALETAHYTALKDFILDSENDKRKEFLKWDLETAESLYQPAHFDSSQIARYVGTYGPNEIINKNNKLYYLDRGYPLALTYMGQDKFMLDESNRLQFVRNNEAVSSLKSINKAGSINEFKKDND